MKALLVIKEIEFQRGNETMKKKEILQATILFLMALLPVNALIPFFTGSKMPLIVLSWSVTPMMPLGDIFPVYML
jgi:signal peptidase